MTDHQAGWIKRLVEPLRVKPGSAVHLPRDFDPGARFGVRKKETGSTCSARVWSCSPNTRTG